jgi:AcrR family transcriptional regulator
MPSFNAATRARIAELLRTTATELFTSQGLHRTSLDDLVRPAGIAKSSFYAFFESKEALYLDLMMAQVSDIRSRLVAAMDTASDAHHTIAALLREIVAVLETNTFYRRLLTHPDELQAVRDRVGPEDLDAVQRELVQPVIDVIARMQCTDQIVRADPAVVLGVLRAVLLTPLHAREFDPDTYPQILDLLIDAVAGGLTTGRVAEGSQP